ncbi:hypothetical protein BJY01DRAFT_253274 [Aspergillus pseudoustus]|uniref:Zn(2)-C6 fungal-type domain-containing protein n=1 Tax=Aspergillus pseudoustus TaxID=1810923 RepID=A0ABR4J2B4_9EURO
MAGLIAPLVVACLQEFGRTKELLSSQNNEIYSTLWRDELGRLRIWAGNVGAHQTGLSSLDYRLRDASHIKKQILVLLNQLQSACSDVRDVLDEVMADDELSDSGSEEVGQEEEMQMIYDSVRDTINCLFQMTIVIRQPAHHDQFLGTRKSDTAHFGPYDRQHVFHKYPNADDKIITRLARGISERRAFLRYRQRHQEKLAHGLSRAMGDKPDTASTKLSETIASEYVERSDESTGFDSRSDITQTSYAQTMLQGRDGIMTVPPMPADAADGAYFECPYCFYIITINNMRSWARHIFNDLRPYICLFPDCTTPQRLYGSRHEWSSHIQHTHSQSFKGSCPLCSSPIGSGPNMEKHIARHLEELALFALPRPETRDDDGELSKQSSKSNSRRVENLDVDSQISDVRDNGGGALACDECRRKKIKCDGKQPCTHCTFYSYDCTYDQPSNRRNNPASPFSATDQTPTGSLIGESEMLDTPGDYETDHDIILLNHRRTIYKFQAAPYSISDGHLTIGQLRHNAAKMLQVADASRLKLLYKGLLLGDDSVPCRVEGLKHRSEVICVVSDPRDDESEDEIETPENRETFTKNPNSSLDVTKRRRLALRPAPTLNRSTSVIEQIRSLSAYFHEELVPQCNYFLTFPPSGDDTRDFEYRVLSETILAQVILKSDSLKPSDSESREARRELIKAAQDMLNAIDPAPSGAPP